MTKLAFTMNLKLSMTRIFGLAKNTKLCAIIQYHHRCSNSSNIGLVALELSLSLSLPLHKKQLYRQVCKIWCMIYINDINDSSSSNGIASEKYPRGKNFEKCLRSFIICENYAILLENCHQPCPKWHSFNHSMQWQKFTMKSHSNRHFTMCTS